MDRAGCYTPTMWGSGEGFCLSGNGGNLGQPQSREERKTRTPGRIERINLGLLFDFPGL